MGWLGPQFLHWNEDHLSRVFVKHQSQKPSYLHFGSGVFIGMLYVDHTSVAPRLPMFLMNDERVTWSLTPSTAGLKMKEPATCHGQLNSSVIVTLIEDAEQYLSRENAILH